MKTKSLSQIVFLQFKDLKNAVKFFSDVLELDCVLDKGWAYVWRTGRDSFVGATEQKKIAERENANLEQIDNKNRLMDKPLNGMGVLISLTVDDIERWYLDLLEKKVLGITEISTVSDIAMRSFFFDGPEGYRFEIQQFESEELIMLFHGRV